jgi:5-methylcytosine-specific restriction endonuclease McrA
MAKRHPIAVRNGLLRDSILAQIVAFKEIEMMRYPKCRVCGKVLSQKTAQVDDMKPEFRDLVRDFVGDTESFDVDTDCFSRHHREHANLQLLCQKCNYAKPRS